jgi:hypothetical protein
MSGHRHIHNDAGGLIGSVWPDGTRTPRKRWAAMPFFTGRNIKRFPTAKAAEDWIRRISK